MDWFGAMKLLKQLNNSFEHATTGLKPGVNVSGTPRVSESGSRSNERGCSLDEAENGWIRTKRELHENAVCLPPQRGDFRK